MNCSFPFRKLCMCKHVCIETNGLIFLQVSTLFHYRIVPAIVYYIEYGLIDFNSTQPTKHDEETSNFLFPFSRLASIRCSPNTTDPISTNIKSTWKTLNIFNETLLQLRIQCISNIHPHAFLCLRL